jgi:hypothetical protein
MLSECRLPKLLAAFRGALAPGELRGVEERPCVQKGPRPPSATERNFGALPALGPVAAVEPEPTARICEPELQVSFCLVPGQPVESRPKVVVFAVEPVDVLAFQISERPPPLAATAFSFGKVIRRMAALSLVGTAALSQSVDGVFADCLQHREPAVSLAHEAFVDESGKRFEGAITDGLGCFERPAAGEHCEASHGHLLLRIQQVIAPGDRRRQCLLSLGKVPRPTGEKRKPLFEAREQGVRRQQLYAGCSQLDGEWQSVETPADVRDGAVCSETGPHGPRALAEERRCVALGQGHHRKLLLDLQT